MADVSPMTDSSTDASTEDKNSRFQNNQQLAVVASDGSDKSRDQKTLRRLAQNREAARKSRLRKKVPNRGGKSRKTSAHAQFLHPSVLEPIVVFTKLY